MLKNRSIEYHPIISRKDSEIISVMLKLPVDTKMPQKLLDDLNAEYQRQHKRNKRAGFYRASKKFVAWYIGLNIALALTIGIGWLFGVDIFAWYIDFLGGISGK